MSDSAGPSLRDYTADSRILYVSALASVLGAGCAVVAWALLELIALATNLFYFHTWSFVGHDPWQSGRHWFTPLMPVVGGVLVGLIARYLSPKVRGHGMPEAVETIVFGGGKVQPRVAVLKPIATAISIGSGGPFGAEGPVIMTGGAIGSVLGQLLPMTSSERTTLMVSGAAAEGDGGGLQLPVCGDAARSGDSAVRVEAAEPGAGRVCLRDGRRDSAVAAGAGCAV